MVKLVKTLEYTKSDIVETVAEKIESDKEKQHKKEFIDEIVGQSDLLWSRYGKSIIVKADDTESLKKLQEVVGISEERVREMQEEHDLSRLHPSRRQDFVQEILDDRVDAQIEEIADEISEEAQTEAVEQVGQLFDSEPSTVEFTWTRRNSGKYLKRRDGDDHFVVTAPNSTNEYGDIQGAMKLPSLIILEDDTKVTVESDIASQTLTLDTGGYSFSPRSFRDLAEEIGLVEIEKRDASCGSSDKEALDVEVGRGDDDGKAHVIELQSGDGGYSSRHTKGWTEYRDIDLEREMVLIVVGQASYYNGSARGKSERAWLVGRDEGQVWSQQVYSTHETVDEALDFMTPAAVQQYREEGREVIRQGDVFFVEMKRSSNYDEIEDTRHDVVEEDAGVIVSHPEHHDLELKGSKWKAYTTNDGSQSGSSRGGRNRTVRD
jgi:hypothetical protein